MSLAAAKLVTGGLSFPSKMPGTSFGLPAAACIAGAKLATVTGSACSICYALRDRYAAANAVKAQRRRLAGIAHPRWEDAMVLLLSHMHRFPTFRMDMGIRNARARNVRRWRMNDAGFHRWHDTGDLQSVEHLGAICAVAARTPLIRHWLPTQELGIVRRYVAAGGSVPANLVIRVSSVMIDDEARRAWPQTSSVAAFRPPEDDDHVCPAPNQDNRCGRCRACWSPDVAHVVYRMH